jgi:hypothetical protein
VHLNWPLRWPDEWRGPAALDLLKGTPLDTLIFPSTGEHADVMARARELGLTVCDAGHPPAGIEIVKGEWPGIRMTEGKGDATSGPTGAPWIDSNGWLIRLSRARKPDSAVWVAADPPKSTEVVPLARHLVALADGAAHGGRWVTTLDKDLAQGLAAGKPASLTAWKRLTRAVTFFQAHYEWSAWPVDAVLAVVSSFAGDNEFFSREVLNLMARTNISYAIVERAGATPGVLRSLRAVVYPDAEPPATELRQTLLDFVERGGLLIAGPRFGNVPGTPVSGAFHPRYEMRRTGKGSIAMAHQQPDDPYELAQDAQILLSHRYDLLRIFNAFLLGGYSTVSPDGKRKLTHIINYVGEAGDDPSTARIAGRFRSAKCWMFETPEPSRLEMAAQKDGVEVHLPRLGVYGGIELEPEEHA